MLSAICFVGVMCGKDGSVDNHMEMGKKLLAAGQLADALSHFHAAVGKRRRKNTSQIIFALSFQRSTLFLLVTPLCLFVRWGSEELHGLLQQSHSVSGNGEVQVCSARFGKSH